KYTTAVYRPEQAVQSTQLAIKHSLSGNPGPVSVIFHSNAINGTVSPSSSPKLYHTKHYLKFRGNQENIGNIQMICKELVQAKKPFIIAGSGVNKAKANDELRTLSMLLGAPVGTTAGGKSAIEEVHSHAVGVIGNWGQN